jgi:hypothetical protein
MAGGTASSTGSRSDDELVEVVAERLALDAERLEDLNAELAEPERPAAPKAPASRRRLPWF